MAHFTSVPPFRDFETSFSWRRDAAFEAATKVEFDTLAAHTSDQIIDTLVEQFEAKPIKPVWGSAYIDPESPGVATRDSQSKTSSPALAFKYWLRIEGAAMALRGVSDVPAQGTGSSEWWIGIEAKFPASSSANELDNLDEPLGNIRRCWFEAVEKETLRANRQIGDERAAMRASVSQIIEPKERQAKALINAAGILEIPIGKTDSQPINIPARPKLLDLSAANSMADLGESKYVLSKKIADAMVKQILDFSKALQRLPLVADRLLGENEESIRDFLLFILNSNWENRVVGEAFSGTGKTDIHMTWEGREAFIGECKFWSGAKKFKAGLDQLLDGYTVWPAAEVALILFIRNHSRPSSVVDTAKEAIQEHKRFHAAAESFDEDMFSAHMKAATDADKLVRLRLVPVVISDPSSG